MFTPTAHGFATGLDIGIGYGMPGFALACVIVAVAVLVGVVVWKG